MKVYVKLFASLRIKYPDVNDLNPLEIEIEKGITMAQLIEKLGLNKEEVRLKYINGKKADYNTRIETENAVIALFPAIGGG